MLNREPLGQVAIPAATILAVLALIGIRVTAGQADTLAQLIAVAAPVVSALATWALGRARVTPLGDPQDAAGRALIPDV